MELGLCSVSFRQLPPREVIRRAADAGLAYIEWGSDIHAPCDDPARLDGIAACQKAAGLACSSYGTYFRIGQDAPAGFRAYCEAAARLGTDTLRVWCGTKSADLTSDSERDALLADSRAVADIAAAYGMTVCLECHRNTYTETLDGALALMRGVDSPSFRMYWQPNQLRTAEENRRYAAAISPYTVNLHVFHWQGDEKYPLADGIAVWREYLACFAAPKTLLLEFMPDGSPDSLPAEAASLRMICKRRYSDEISPSFR